MHSNTSLRCMHCHALNPSFRCDMCGAVFCNYSCLYNSTIHFKFCGKLKQLNAPTTDISEGSQVTPSQQVGVSPAGKLSPIKPREPSHKLYNNDGPVYQSTKCELNGNLKSANRPQPTNGHYPRNPPESRFKDFKWLSEKDKFEIKKVEEATSRTVKNVNGSSNLQRRFQNFNTNFPNEKDKVEMASTVESAARPTSFSSYVMVSCIHKENGLLWVIGGENQTKFNHVQTKLSCATLESGAHFKPKLKMLCAAFYLNEWARAQVINLNPLEVHFIDYGNSSVINEDLLRCLPNELNCIPALAYAVKFQDQNHYAHTQIGDNLEILEVAVEDNVKIVTKKEVINRRNRGETHVPHPSQSLSTSMGALRIKPAQSTNMSPANTSSLPPQPLATQPPCHVPFSSEILPPNAHSNGKSTCPLPSLPPFKPPSLMTPPPSKPPPNAASQSRSPPVTGHTLYPSATVSPSQNLNAIPQPQKMQATAAPPSQKLLAPVLPPANTPQLLYTTDALMSKNPSSPYNALTTSLRFPSNSSVIVEIAVSTNTLFISWLNEAAHYIDLNDNIGLQCNGYSGVCADWEDDVTGAPLNELPPIKAIVAGNFEGSYYRAEVIGHHEGNARLFFCDFGNIALSPLAGLRSLSKSLRDAPSAVQLVRLKGVPDGELVTANYFLDRVISDRLNLTLMYEGAAENGVELHFDGSNCNELFMDQISSPKELGISTNDEYVVAQLEEGIHDLYVTHWSESEPNVSFCGLMAHNYHYIADELPKSIEEFVSSHPKPYMPHVNEICAVYDENFSAWARAICLQPVGEDAAEMFFIDEGRVNVLSIDLIRPLPADLKKTPAFANKCIIAGLDEMTQADRELVMTYTGPLKASVSWTGSCYQVTVDIENIKQQILLADTVNKNLHLI